MPDIQVESDGSVEIDSNAFDLMTGPNQNNSNIPMPRGLVEQTQENVSQPVRPDQEAPNSVDIRVDTDNINQQLQPAVPGFVMLDDSLRLSTEFNLQYIPGQHDYGEGIQLTVYGPDGSVKTTESAFVRGDRVDIGPDGQPLPAEAQISAVYGAEDTVELRVSHLVQDGGEPQQSGIYFNTDGQFVVEDQSPANGSDLDFNDGQYVELSMGRGEADIVSESQSITRTLSYRTEIVETPLPPLTRQEQVTENNRLQLDQTFTETTEERQAGQVEIVNSEANLLAHATGANAADGTPLIYDRYFASAQARLGTDGASLTGQLSPLVNNPAAPPTLVTGTLNFNPGVVANQAGLTATVGLTQFFNSTHHDAVDMYGHRVVNPDSDGPRLIQPTGLIDNTQLVGFVPPTRFQVVPGQPLTPADGIYELPEDQDIVIEPPVPNLVGPGDAAYTRNVGGLIVERTDGTATFLPQWNEAGYATASTRLEAGRAQRVIYALVPQQAGQDLQLGQEYALTNPEGTGYRTANGGFEVIAANQHPANFQREQPNVYAVEDTLPGENAETARFNGLRGLYRNVPGGPLVSTVDVSQPERVDARVGNPLSTPEVLLPGSVGQAGYLKTTFAGGLYVRGELALGLGNQEDVVTTTASTYRRQLDVAVTQMTTNLLATPRTRVDTRTTEIASRQIETTRRSGEADFDIDADGTLSNINVRFNDIETSSQVETTEGPTSVDTMLRLGPEYVAASTTEITDREVLADSTSLIDRQTTTERESYPNLTPLRGELAIGGVLNIGNTPWTPAANVLRAELFTQGTTIGQGRGGDTGWRVEAVFNPFGEQQRPAYRYNLANRLAPIYKTTPLLDENGDQVVTLLANADGQPLPVETYEFVYDETGDRIIETVGTGEPVGPGVYLRVEDVFNGDSGLSIFGGLKFDL
ncbi:hypothetical protein C7293_03480 [filamentous cyanobacterium CCT1]|nr:hypothetical protein C7293_03480 [filamentous cyanobacterium CCT1]PSN79713.1 hypothetical protein C8B47_10240 [filamentous cyanobacterium CCP4]